MKEKYDELKMEVIAFEEGIWTTMNGTTNLVGAASGGRRTSTQQTPAGTVTNP